MFDWDDARFFLAVHRTGSLSAAGRRIQVNQTTVGRRIASLEETLGVRLFEKGARGFTLTGAGERFLPHAERIEDEVHATALEISGQESRLSGTVRVTAADAFGPFFVTPLLAEFRGRYPEIEVELNADVRVLSLSKREADIALRNLRPKEATLVSRKLANFGIAMYASKSYVEARGRPKGRDLSAHDLIDFETSVSPTQEARWYEQNARKGRTVFRSNSTWANLHACAAGLGLALIPCYLGDPHPGLVRVMPPEDVIVRDLYMVMHRDLRHSARVRACADFLVRAHAKRALELAGSAKALRA
jgi:DNA-binding transcriptional LysR family regulator